VRPATRALIAVFWVATLIHAAIASPAQDQSSQAVSQSPAAGPLVTLQGVVLNTNTGQPLPRALVRIEGDANTGALTDSEGRFQIPGLPAGPQTIRIHKPGFRDRSYATEDVGYQSDGPAHNVLVAAGMPDLVFTLTPTSAIYGHVDLSTGDPAQGISLTLLKQVVSNGRAVWVQNSTTKTNGFGAYRFAGLPAGVYALFSQPALESEPATTALADRVSVTRSGYPGVFYPQAQEFSGATRIWLAAGDQAEANMHLTLEPFYAVTATAILPNGKPYSDDGLVENSSPGPGPATVLDSAGHLMPYTVQFDPRNHVFQANLPDGSYTLFVGVAFEETNTNPPVEMVGRNRKRVMLLSGFAEVSIEGHSVSNLRIPLSPLSNWPIHLRAVRTSVHPVQSSTSPNQGLQATVVVEAIHAGEAPMDGPAGDGPAESMGSDLLELSAFALGPHWISTQLNDRSLCVDSFTAGGSNLAREPLNVPLGASAPRMELTLRDDCAKLALTLPPALAEFLPGDEPFYTVYVVPDFDTTTDIPPMNMHPSSGASLNVDGLTPGSYHVYVFDHPVRLEYRNPAALAALPTPGQPVTLSAGATSSLLLEVLAQ
jgi:hypothetical protein